MTFPRTHGVALTVLLTVPAMAQESASRASLEHEHAAWTSVLATSVKSGELGKKGDGMEFLDYDWSLNGR